MLDVFVLVFYLFFRGWLVFWVDLFGLGGLVFFFGGMLVDVNCGECQGCVVVFDEFVYFFDDLFLVGVFCLFFGFDFLIFEWVFYEVVVLFGVFFVVLVDGVVFVVVFCWVDCEEVEVFVGFVFFVYVQQSDVIGVVFCDMSEQIVDEWVVDGEEVDVFVGECNFMLEGVEEVVFVGEVWQ